MTMLPIIFALQIGDPERMQEQIFELFRPFWNKTSEPYIGHVLITNATHICSFRVTHEEGENELSQDQKEYLSLQLFKGVMESMSSLLLKDTCCSTSIATGYQFTDNNKKTKHLFCIITALVDKEAWDEETFLERKNTLNNTYEEAQKRLRNQAHAPER